MRILAPFIKTCLSLERSAKGVRFCGHINALRPKKPKALRKETSHFVDCKTVRVVGGKGGDGCISFLQLWANERAGPDGGDGGNGAHVIFQASEDVRNFNHLSHTVHGADGEKGSNKDCNGKNAKHNIVKVPIGTVIRDQNGEIIADLNRADLMFVAARGGSGGKGNRYFATPTERSPKISEYGPDGEDITYVLEVRSIADVGLIGFPNVGKSTLLNAISRAKPKIAPYAFTTLRPHVGIVKYDNFTQIRVADLPGLIEDSHLNRGLGIQFLKHAERCSILMFVLDASSSDALNQYQKLLYELKMFNAQLLERPKILVANKIDKVASAEAVVQELQQKLELPVVPISAKMGTNITKLLTNIQQMFQKYNNQSTA